MSEDAGYKTPSRAAKPLRNATVVVVPANYAPSAITRFFFIHGIIPRN